MTMTRAATIIRMPRPRLTIGRELHPADQEQKGGDHRQGHRTRKFVHSVRFTKT